MSGSGTAEDERSAIRKQWDAFTEFAYNPGEKTVMGRTGRSWAKILIFYFFYYGFLACLFAASISIVLGTLDEYTPKYQTRLQTPGVAIQPKFPSNYDQSSDITYSLKKDDNYNQLVKQIDEFLAPYNPAKQNDTSGFKNCPQDAPPNINQKYNGGETAYSCKFSKELLGDGTDCATSPYGYDIGKPCIYIKINRIIGWFPVGFTDLDVASGYSESGAPDLAEVLQAFKLSYKPYLIYTVCYGDEDEDKKNLDSGVMTNNLYSPKDMGIPFAYYPYEGSKRQPSYLNPLVAVQFTNVTKGVDIDVSCKVYALNIRDNKEMGEGFFRFMIRIDE